MLELPSIPCLLVCLTFVIQRVAALLLNMLVSRVTERSENEPSKLRTWLKQTAFDTVTRSEDRIETFLCVVIYDECVDGRAMNLELF